MNRPLRLAAGVIVLMSSVPLIVSAQPIPAGQFAPATAADTMLSDAQLDQLTAPIALYPDALLGQILMAATYPLEVVEARRWRQDPANSALTGDGLAAALQSESWDLSIKSLVPFAQILQMMDSHIEWTEQIGDAFIAQQAAVMDSIQRLRQRAAAAGSLTSTPQQTVATADQDIEIDPVNPDLIYVPDYDSDMVYGTWPWPDDPPDDFPLPTGIDIAIGGTLLGFSSGVPVVRPLWGWHHWDWPHHGLDIDGGGARPGMRSGPWQHDPAHRRGVPYRNAAVAARYQADSAAARRDLRGFPTVAIPQLRPALPERGPDIVPREVPTRIAPPSARTIPPAFESFDEGARVRGEAARGAASRAAPARSAGGRPAAGAGAPSRGAGGFSRGAAAPRR